MSISKSYDSRTPLCSHHFILVAFNKLADGKQEKIYSMYFICRVSCNDPVSDNPVLLPGLNVSKELWISFHCLSLSKEDKEVLNAAEGIAKRSRL